MNVIDLRSDTVTKPCKGMRKAMANAVVGDDVLGDDPTVIALEEKIADIMGKEAAVFVPSGTMANQIAIWLHTRRGDSIAVQKDAHIFHYEAGGPAILSSVMMRPIGGVSGIMDTAQLSAAIPPVDPHFAPLSLICVEDTANKGGGSVYPMPILSRINQIAKECSAKTHLDGARIFNAVVASGIAANIRVKDFNTVSVCFSKGLGAPVGSALCLPRGQVAEAKRARKAFGGGMRQSGVLAAAAIYALDVNLPNLSEDHEKIKLLANALKNTGVKVREPESNMVYFECDDASSVVAAAKEKGIWCLNLGPTTIRLVCHRDIDMSQARKAAGIFEELLS